MSWPWHRQTEQWPSGSRMRIRTLRRYGASAHSRFLPSEEPHRWVRALGREKRTTSRWTTILPANCSALFFQFMPPGRTPGVMPRVIISSLPNAVCVPCFFYPRSSMLGAEIATALTIDIHMRGPSSLKPMDYMAACLRQMCAWRCRFGGVPRAGNVPIERRI